MADVYDALRDYEQALSDRGFNLSTAVAPGLERSRIIEHLQGAGVESIEELVDWFHFANGLAPGRYQEPQLYGIFGNIELVSLDIALAERKARLDPNYQTHSGFDELQLGELRQDGLIVDFRRSWMPISAGKETCVVETDCEAERHVMALWNDELETRVKALSLLDLVRTFIAQVDHVHLAPLRDASTIGQALFGLGEETMTSARARRLESVAANPFLDACDAVRLARAPVGSLAGNDAMEANQVAEAERILRSLGLDDWRFEVVEADPEPDVTHLHVIEILGVLRPQE